MAQRLSDWRALARRVITETLEALPPGVTLADKRKAVRAAYPFGERKHHPYKMWLVEVSLALGVEAGKYGKPRLQVLAEGVDCNWCPKGRTDCIACYAARLEWAAGAFTIYRRFPRDTPPGIVADMLDEAGFGACAKILRTQKEL